MDAWEPADSLPQGPQMSWSVRAGAGESAPAHVCVKSPWVLLGGKGFCLFM